MLAHNREHHKVKSHPIQTMLNKEQCMRITVTLTDVMFRSLLEAASVVNILIRVVRLSYHPKSAPSALVI